MKTIELTQGYVALVDDEDFERLSKYKWQLREMHGNFYAQRSRMIHEDNYKKKVKMHREILGLTDPKILVDHIDKNGLNNQKSNLRICDNYGNKKNGRSHKDSSSKYVGVSWDKKSGKWTARIMCGKIYKSLGYFVNEIDAAVKRDEYAKLYHGEFASLNFPEL